MKKKRAAGHKDDAGMLVAGYWLVEEEEEKDEGVAGAGVEVTVFAAAADEVELLFLNHDQGDAEAMVEAKSVAAPNGLA